MTKKIFAGYLVFVLTSAFCLAQEKMIDQVVAVVGGNVVYQSDIENQFLQLRAQNYYSTSPSLKCEIFEDLLMQKLFLNQAQIDSIEVTETQVESELDRRLRVFINQVGSEEKLEQYYKKSLPEIKDDFRDIIRDQLLTQRMQAELSEGITITPSEVRSYFNKIPGDSIPEVPLQYELRQIVKRPGISDEEIFGVKERLLSFRKRVMDGENFATLAVLYSEDKTSAVRGGELGFMNRGDLVKEFADVAFSLKQNQISNIVETEYGYHIIQMIERRNDQVNVRHILLNPKVSPEAAEKAIEKLDSLATLIRADSIPFEQAAFYLSDDEDTKLNGGIMVNPNSGTTRFESGDLDRPTAIAIADLREKELTDAFRSTDSRGKEIYKIVRLDKIIPAHKVTLKDDYAMIQNMALNDKKMRIIQEWITEKQASTYIRIEDSQKRCPFRSTGWFK